MKRIFAIFLAISMALLAGCAKDGKEGVAGPAGVDGKNGVDANGTCIKCHSNSQLIVSKEYQWQGTLHNVGESWLVEGSNPSCQKCHSGSGYVAYVGSKPLGATDSLSPSNVNCRTCHNIHVAYDSTDWNLTNTAPIKLVYSTATTVDLGKGNLCGWCHQSRTNPTWSIDTVTGTTVKLTQRWGGHHGPQTNIVAAIGGWETGDAGVGKQSQTQHKLNTNDGCVRCHVSAEGGKNHEFGPVAASCNTSSCHANGVKDSTSQGNGWVVDGERVQTNFQALMNQVRDTLVAYNALVIGSWTAADTMGHSAAVRSTWVAAQSASYQNVYGVYPANAGVVSKAVGGLCFNYFLCLEDKSMGVHNLKYEVYLLTSALTAVTGTTTFAGGF